MKCWDRFDSIVCLHKASAVERHKGLIEELERVGIKVHRFFSFHYTQLTDFDTAVYKALSAFGYNLPHSIGQLDCARGHINIIAQELARGSNEILVLEDDIRFLNDCDEIENIVSKWNPQKDGDICLFDRFIWDERLKDAVRFCHDTFIPFEKNIRGGSCYALSREGMKQMLEASNNLISMRKQIPMNDYLYDFMTCRKCIARKCVCIQKEFTTSNNLKVYKCSNYDVYKSNGVNLVEYNLA